MLIKVSNVRTRELQSEEKEENGLLSSLKVAPSSISQSILEKNWSRLFSGVAVVDIAFLDESLVVFDVDLLARMKGRRICARKEPDFF